MKYLFACLLGFASFSASAHTFKVITDGPNHGSVITTYRLCNKVLQINTRGDVLIDLECSALPTADSSQDLSPPLKTPKNWSYTVNYQMPGLNGSIIHVMGENCRVSYYSDEIDASAVDCRGVKWSAH